MCGKRRLMRTSDRAALVMQRLLPQQQRPDGRDREVTWRAPGPCDAALASEAFSSKAAPLRSHGRLSGDIEAQREHSVAPWPACRLVHRQERCDG
jgi:hypothetical protein